MSIFVKNKFFVLGMLAMALAGFVFIGCDTGTGGGGFVAVTNITNIPRIAIKDVELELGGVVVPSNATSQTITWSGDDVSNGVFTASSNGEHTVTATIVNGASESSPYTENFTITVYDEDGYKIALAEGSWTKSSTTAFGSGTTDTMTITGSAFEMENSSIPGMPYVAGIIVSLSGTTTGDYIVQINATAGQDGQLQPDFFSEEGTYTFTDSNTKLKLETEASYYNGTSPSEGIWTKEP